MIDLPEYAKFDRSRATNQIQSIMKNEEIIRDIDSSQIVKEDPDCNRLTFLKKQNALGMTEYSFEDNIKKEAANVKTTESKKDNQGGETTCAEQNTTTS